MEAFVTFTDAQNAIYTKTCVKRPLKIRQNKDPHNKW